MIAGYIYLVELSKKRKRRLATSIIRAQRKQKKRCNKFKAKVIIICFVHVDFFHKEAYNSIVVRILLLLLLLLLYFFKGHDFKMITLKKNLPKNNGFLIAEKPVAVAIIAGKELFLFHLA